MTKHAQQLADIVTLQKGKVPPIMPYAGLDAEAYLSPEFLRGQGEPEFAKPAVGLIQVAAGEVLILWDGSNAGEVFRAKDGLLASTMTRVDHAKRFDDTYFYYTLKAWESYLKGQTSGSGIPHVDKELLGRLEIYEPDPVAQERIATVLSTIDIAIAQTEALIAKQQRIKAGLMQDLLTRGIDEHGNARSEATHAFKDSPLGRVPVEWDPTSLEKLYSASPRNGIYIPASAIGEGTLMVGQNAISEHRRIDANRCRRASVTKSEEEAYSIRHGDLLISRVYAVVSGVGVPILVEGLSEPAVFESNMLRLRFDLGKIEPEFLFLLLRSHSVRVLIESAVNASNQVSLNQKSLNALRFCLPKLDEQRSIVERVRCLESSIRQLQLAGEKLGRQRVALMQDLLTGKVPVTPLLEAEEASA